MDLGTSTTPLRVAIIGSGPAGFFAAGALFKASIAVELDMFERFPMPYGLVRFGVAPDHPQLKLVSRIFDRIAMNTNFNYLGNVSVGKDISVTELHRYYDALIFACGAQESKYLDIPGETVSGSYSSAQFVGWYNGHPEFSEQSIDFSHRTAVVIGNGNVALDVARMLLQAESELALTDSPAYALSALAESRIRTVYIIGRRRAIDAAFTAPSLQEMSRIKDCDVRLDPQALQLSKGTSIENSSARSQRLWPVLQQLSRQPSMGHSRRLCFCFLQHPVAMQGGDKLEAVLLARNKVTDRTSRGIPDRREKTEILPCGLLIRCIGYRGKALPGLPFDDSLGIIPNHEGRIMAGQTQIPGFYVSGWIKRGPSGVIGTNKSDSSETIRSLLEDIEAGKITPCSYRSTEPLQRRLKERNIQIVTYPDWERLKQFEIKQGRKRNKACEKLTSISDALDILHK